jgi:predicted esterase
MANTYSQLAYRQVESTNQLATPRTIIALHGHRGSHDDLVPLATSIDKGIRAVAPEAARGVYRSVQLLSRTWFGGTIGRPEPASFGDSLAQIERFIHDVRNREGGANPSRPWLLGYDQGAVLALSIGLIAPELISGVMAICGGLPTFSDPTLLEPVESDLPVLLIGDNDQRDETDTQIASTASTMERLGHRVTVEWVEGASKLDSNVVDRLRAWFPECARDRAGIDASGVQSR